MGRIRSFIYTLLFITFCTSIVAQTNSALRSFDTTQLKAWKSQTAFQYDRAIMPAVSFWDKVRSWLLNIWRSIMDNPVGERSFWGILIILSVILIIFIARKYSGNTNGLWSKSNLSNTDSDNWEEENIHNIDFESQIQQALSKNNNRLAIRLRYLFLLKILDDENYIKWRPGKTNYDYAKEIYQKSPDGAFPLFQKISFAFEFAWYGDHGATVEDYEQTNALFESLRNNSFNAKTTANESV